MIADPPGSARPTLSLPEFEGPLELLLTLIERGRLPITRVSLAVVADQYLAAVRALPSPDPDLLVRFLVVAGKLLLIKSQALLPAPERTEEDDPADDLERRLAEYALLREAARHLAALEERGCRSYPPPPRPTSERASDGLEPLDPWALLRLLARPARSEPLPPVLALARARASVEGRLAMLEALLDGRGEVELGDVLGDSVDEVIATFLAVLELIRRGRAQVEQREPFGPIRLWRNGSAVVEAPSRVGEQPAPVV